jgi:Zn-dependent M28 family amino/carboxypeptidase
MKSLLLTSLIVFSSVYAHEDHDWREDYMGYLSVHYELPMTYQKSTQGPDQRRIFSRKRVDMEFFKTKLAVLTGAAPFGTLSINDRKSNENLDLARKFLKEEYEKLGLIVRFEAFGSGKNFVAEKLGTKDPKKVLILSSHIDSVRNRGANDNGTGTIGLLAVAKELSKKDYAYTIRILGFDKEEVGLVGSDAYVAALQDKTSLIGNINFEMMGVNSRKDGAFHVIDCNKTNSVFLTEAIKTSIANQGLALTVVKACTDRSDHASFWRHKLPAVVISENFFGGDADPCYHAKCDVMDDRLDYNYMSNILSAVFDASESLLK